jgi:hypothetical protein
MIRLIAAAALAAPVLAAAPAAAAPSRTAAVTSAVAVTSDVGAGPVRGARRKTELVLSYAAVSGSASAVVLRCDPARGTHPHKFKACRLLKSIGGRPDRLRPTPGACTMEYAPVTARITGIWRGRELDWSRTFANRCLMLRTTGVLMDF